SHPCTEYQYSTSGPPQVDEVVARGHEATTKEKASGLTLICFFFLPSTLSVFAGFIIALLANIVSAMAKWWIGCSGFHYKHWKGIFYPEKLAQSKWFDYYNNSFLTLELNTTFYRFPRLSSL